MRIATPYLLLFITSVLSALVSRQDVAGMNPSLDKRQSSNFLPRCETGKDENMLTRETF
jgi:hypothetical protein